MVRTIRETGFGILGLVAGLASQMLSAQAIALPASDPVGIGRSGTGVAFGQSLEAASLNPALLVTLKDPASAFLSMGIEAHSFQTTLMSTEHTLWSKDRNRGLPAFGSAWRLSDKLVLGLKMDAPFMRHGALSDESTIRFQQQSIQLETRRLEAQVGWSMNPNWSVGMGLGVARVYYASEAALRVNIPGNPRLPISDSNPTEAMMELPLIQSGKANVLTYSLGARWAINPRWTIGAAYQGPIRATLDMAAGATSEDPMYYAKDGFSTPEKGSEKGAEMLNVMRSASGNGRICLPARASIGVRQRFNQYMTWEADFRYMAGKSLELPTQPVLQSPSGTVSTPGVIRQPRDVWGVSGTIELAFTKKWTARGGVELLSGLLTNSTVEPFIGGAPTAGFSLGTSYKALGGEWSIGYQYRQSQDVNSHLLDGVWNSEGYTANGTPVAVEGMGHLISIGFKKAF